MYKQRFLASLNQEHDFFIGIDSDGCVFDSMEVKQKEFFIPNALKYFNLFAISKIFRETWEFVNLYSVYRGGNRFISLLKVFELLQERKDFKDSGIQLPDISPLKEWVSNETNLGNDSLRKYFDSHYSSGLEKVVKWTEAVNEDISKWLRAVPSFPYATVTINEMSSFADIIIVSQTPLEALHREWEEHDLKKYVKAIAGQENGTKTEQIAVAIKGKYSKNKILMIGDAKGDLVAAKENGILFYPIIPGKENKSWKRLFNEGLTRFRSGNFEGRYEEDLHTEFNISLPEKPSWEL